MKRSVRAAAIGMGICLGFFSAYAGNGEPSGRVVCDETCKLGSAEPAGSGKAAKPTAKAPGFSVVSPVGLIAFSVSAAAAVSRVPSRMATILPSCSLIVVFISNILNF